MMETRSHTEQDFVAMEQTKKLYKNIMDNSSDKALKKKLNYFIKQIELINQ